MYLVLNAIVSCHRPQSSKTPGAEPEKSKTNTPSVDTLTFILHLNSNSQSSSGVVMHMLTPLPVLDSIQIDGQ